MIFKSGSGSETENAGTARIPHTLRDTTSPLHASSSDPMQVGHSHLSADEWARRFREGHCLYCGRPGHLIRSCPVHPSREAPVRNRRSSDSEAMLIGRIRVKGPIDHCEVPVTLLLPEPHRVTALIDSGSSVNLIDRTLVQRLLIPHRACTSPRSVTTLDGRPLAHGMLDMVTEPLEFLIQDTCQKATIFFIIDIPAEPLVLGYPWLVIHQPQINWTKGIITGWGKQRSNHTQTELYPMTPAKCNVVDATPDLTLVPPEYHHLAELFIKKRATTLPPCRPYDLAIKLLPGTTPSRGRLYPLLVPGPGPWTSTLRKHSTRV